MRLGPSRRLTGEVVGILVLELQFTSSLRWVWGLQPMHVFQARSRPLRLFVFSMLALGLALSFALGVIVSSPQARTATQSAPLYDEKLVTAVFERASPAVVEISVRRNAPDEVIAALAVGSGSGFLVDRQGHIVTNHHVVAGSDTISVRLQDGRMLVARLLGSSAADDLALLQVDPAEIGDVEPLTLADSASVVPGQMAIAVGSPFRQFNSVSVGVVSGTGRGPASVIRRPIPDMIQTDAALNPGNSGGPLLNSDGEVIGVNSAVRTGEFSSLGDYRVGFAVPSNTVRGLLPRLVEARELRRPWLGISGTAVADIAADSLGLPDGVYVSGVFPDSPAERAGLVPFRRLERDSRGDVITAVEGRPVGSLDEMVGYFNELAPGEAVTLSVFRDRRSIEVDVTLGEWPDT